MQHMVLGGYNDIKTFLAPTWRKIVTTIALEVISVLMSVYLSVTAIGVGSTLYYSTVSIILAIINAGGSVGHNMLFHFYFRDGLYEGIAYRGVIYFGLTAISQLLYFYLITCVFIYISKYRNNLSQKLGTGAPTQRGFAEGPEGRTASNDARPQEGQAG